MDDDMDQSNSKMQSGKIMAIYLYIIEIAIYHCIVVTLYSCDRSQPFVVERA